MFVRIFVMNRLETSASSPLEKIKNFAHRTVALGSAMMFLSVPTLAESKTENSDINQDTVVITNSDKFIEEPTAEVKAAVTASVEDPEAKVSVEDLKIDI